ncbi:S-adenosylmethionine:tRNA ribosyltransferase-isomerase [Sediminitomix flava]|uniref:S-adenosylmethionine:tRNA ribosyltransferase-isomerase n=1 Tax=Sediminitomix flava TaxID=379075 RepID=A0A315Z7C0_SEDFL|nr:S-adenosylmethionine:tRNA ribosyltransferase-isomerase [Sediminitomix flava]PWJ38501.1 S-adenosylmethionine:tRNA ribosyltransferase-isomerase [Sediminitomix flava]
MKLTKIALSDYHYDLPADRIAKYPKEKRDESKLLVYREGEISNTVFKEIPTLIPDNHQFFFNNTKVLPARLYFKKETGAIIEIFLFNPVAPTAVISEAMLVKGEATWSTTVGNFKKWKDGQVLETMLNVNGQDVLLAAHIEDREKKLIRFEWSDKALPFVDIISSAGETPLPPYLKRKATEKDKTTYQTVFSKNDGAVAAPTAGLHFSEEVVQNLKGKSIPINELTLHVSAGTFKPIEVENAIDHDMHYEQVIVTKANLEALISGKKNIAVGTTSLRTLESLYWYGVKVMKEGENAPFDIKKLEPYNYEESELPTREESFKSILDLMIKLDKEELAGVTSIFVFPGYKFRVIDALVTNFHLPETTLVLLIAAFIGEDWRKVYEHAMDNDFQFLSYGDSSILFPKQ